MHTQCFYAFEASHERIETCIPRNQPEIHAAAAAETDTSRTNPGPCKGRYPDLEPAATISAIPTNTASARSQTNYLQAQSQSTKAETWISCAVKDENRQARIIATET
ncbi:hypothetical protein KC343_g1031 [Hortaea werneckii]|nr:hypothetical protein KC338_g8075 [Hortaea werneckii]KAI6867720.1 hypothetical protein KC323_g3417 [Hortaea werneckii]KAI7264252.1 hypothetical protein KC352_g9324 [Hortaea werneckii]KAI7354357.1 hypothetical protein KC320_g3448 [Hortaea werneckii]KAI7572091.1 hypothetical protein KC317_g1071 [Hortaea werneckii]